LRYRFKTKPRPYQVRALKKLIKNRGGHLWIPMRGGKTKVAIDFVGSGQLKWGWKRVLVICPKKVRPVWKMEIKKHQPEDIDLEWAITNYERTYAREPFGNSWRPVDNQELWDFRPDVIIIDEGHRVGDPTTLANKKIYKLSKKYGIPVVILTGTPVHRKIFLAFGMFKLDDDSVFGTDWGSYKSQYGLWGGYQRRTLLKYANLKLWREKVEPRVFSMRYVPPVPPQHILRPFELETSSSTYRELMVDSVTAVKGHQIEAPIVLTKILKGMQIAGGWLRDTEKGVWLRTGNEKKEAFDELVHEIRDSEIHKFVVFCRFLPEMRDAADVARRYGYTVLSLRGKTTEAALEHRLEVFAEKKARLCFVVQATTGGEGLDFSAADTAVYYSLPAGLLPYDQSSARIRRWKDKRTLTYFYLAARGTVDELAYLAIQEGLEVVDMVQHHPTLLNYEAEG
jgi:SNF2 family DNA or RNA helicase